MTKQTRRKKPGAKTKRGFAVLDRDDAIKAAAGAVGLLRTLFKFAISPAGWRCGLGIALELLEVELNDILLYSGANRLPDNSLGDAEPVAVPADLGRTRKDRSEERRVGKECRSRW